MSVDDIGNKKGFFAPPNAFGGQQNPAIQQRPVVSNVSQNPAHSQLYTAATNRVNLPELLTTLRVWHRGKPGRGPNNERVMIPWFALEVIHLDSATVIYVHDLQPDDADEDLQQLVEERIENRYRGYGEQQQRFEVRCHFRDQYDNIAWEPFTCCINLPPQTSSYGQPHHGGVGLAGYGGAFNSGGGIAGFGAQNGFGRADNQLAVQLRGNIEDRQLSYSVLFRAVDMIENHCRRLEASNMRHEDRQMQVVELIDTLQDNSAKRKLDQQMAELKMAALQTALEKTLHALPMGFAVLNRWLQHKKEEKQGPVTSRQKKAEDTLKNICVQLQKGPAGQNPDMVRAMLMQSGISEQTVDDAFHLFQEFYIDQAMENAETKVKQSILGVGEGDDGLKRLLKAANVAIPGEAENDSSDDQKKADAK